MELFNRGTEEITEHKSKAFWFFRQTDTCELTNIYIRIRHNRPDSPEIPAIFFKENKIGAFYYLLFRIHETLDKPFSTQHELRPSFYSPQTKSLRIHP